MPGTPNSFRAQPAALVAVVAAAIAWTAAPSYALEGVMLDRPVFDRDSTTVVIPYKGGIPRFQTESLDNNTRIFAYFMGSQARLETPYKLGIFHPFVSKVEMTPIPGQGRVRVGISLTQPGRLAIIPDARLGVLRLQVGRIDMSQEPQPPEPVAVGFGAGPMLPQGRPEERLGMMPLTPGPPLSIPRPIPSLPPVRLGGNNPLPGTPASGEYVFRKVVPTEDGKGVTEVAVRTSRRTDIAIDRNPINDSVVVNVTQPGVNPGINTSAPEPGAFVAPGADYTRPLPNQPYRMPTYRGEPTFKPVAAIDAVAAYMLMSETATSLGSNWSGNGSSLFGLTAHVPLGTAFNMNLGAETFSYTINSVQVPDATTRRDEFFGQTMIEYLPVRKPWVLATGIGYWGRYVQARNNVLPPPTPSLLFAPTQLYHGPALGTRAYFPIWNGLAFQTDLSAAPYMFGGNDATAVAVGNVYGYQGMAGMKWSVRHFAATLGYRHQGYGSFNGEMTYNRGGPEVSLVWRF